jgi:hypothetical protein
VRGVIGAPEISYRRGRRLGYLLTPPTGIRRFGTTIRCPDAGNENGTYPSVVPFTRPSASTEVQNDCVSRCLQQPTA